MRSEPVVLACAVRATFPLPVPDDGVAVTHEGPDTVQVVLVLSQVAVDPPDAGTVHADRPALSVQLMAVTV